MTTSALALHDLLKPIQENKKSSGTMAAILARKLNLEGAGGEHLAIARTMELVGRVRQDISSVVFDENARRALSKNFEAFGHLQSYEFYAKGAQAAFQASLGNDAFYKLYNIHLALDGKAQRYEDPEALDEIAKDIQTLIEKTLSSGLPKELASVLEKRLSAVLSAVNHYRVWGYEGLQDALSLLIGDTFLFGSQIQSETESSTIKKVLDVAKKGASFLRTAAQASRDSGVLIEEGTKAAELLQGISETNLLGGG